MFKLPSKSTHIRCLVYFLVDLDAVNPKTAATYLVEAGLKAHTVEELIEQMLDLKENNFKLTKFI